LVTVSYHLVDGTPIRAGVVMLLTQPAALSASQRSQASSMYDAGC